MRDFHTASELQNDQYQSDAESVLREIEEQLTQEAEALIGSADGLYKLFTYCEPDVIPNIVAILSAGRGAGNVLRAVDKMSAYLLGLASNMLRDEVTARVMEERECVEYGYED